MLKQVCVEPPSALNVTLPAFAAQRRRLQNDACSTITALCRYLLPTGSSAANPPAAADAVDRWDKWTDRQLTITQTLHTMWAASISQRSRENWTPSLSLTLPDDNGTMDVCNRAHADRPRCKWCHGLCCLIPMSIRVRLQLTAVWKVTATSVCGLGRRCWSSPQLVSILNMTGM